MVVALRPRGGAALLRARLPAPLREARGRLCTRSASGASSSSSGSGAAAAAHGPKSYGKLHSIRSAGAAIDTLASQHVSRDAKGRPFTVRSSAILPFRLVEHPHVKAALPFLGNAAYMALASGFLMTDVFVLRMMLVGGYSGLVGYHLLQVRPLRIPLGWSGLFVVINSLMAAKLALERWPSGLTEEDKVTHEAFFGRLSAAQFKQLLDLAERRTLSDGTRLTTERTRARSRAPPRESGRSNPTGRGIRLERTGWPRVLRLRFPTVARRGGGGRGGVA